VGARRGAAQRSCRPTMCQMKRLCRFLAHRVISLQSSALVAFGGKRTSTDGQSRPVASRMTHSGPRSKRGSAPWGRRFSVGSGHRDVLILEGWTRVRNRPPTLDSEQGVLCVGCWKSSVWPTTDYNRAAPPIGLQIYVFRTSTDSEFAPLRVGPA
jgi:hypothetical protein